MPRNDVDWEAQDWAKSDIQIAMVTGKSKNCVAFHRKRLGRPHVKVADASAWWARPQFGKGYGR